MLITLTVPHIGKPKIREYENQDEIIEYVYNNNKYRDCSDYDVLPPDGSEELDPNILWYTITNEFHSCPRHSDNTLQPIGWAWLVLEQDNYMFQVFHSREELYEFVRCYSGAKAGDIHNTLKKYVRSFHNNIYGELE